MKLLNKQMELRKEAIEIIKSSGGRVLWNDDGTEEGRDILLEMPFVTYVDKYSGYHQYAIGSYKVEDDKIIFKTYEVYEDMEEMDFEHDDVNTEALLWIADIC